MDNNQNIFVGPKESMEQGQLMLLEVNHDVSVIAENLNILVEQRQPFLVADLLIKLQLIHELTSNLSCDSATYVNEVLFDFNDVCGDASPDEE